MYGLTRATITLIAAAVAGFLVWLATTMNDHSTGGYWADYGLIAAAGLVMALSQLLGGWTKWGWPHLSGKVFLIAFLPVLIVAGWILLLHQPHGNWFRHHVRSWSGDLHLRGLANDFRQYRAVLAFGIGLVFGYSFDTTGPVVERGWGRRRTTVTDDAVTTGAGSGATAAGEARRVEIRDGESTGGATRVRDEPVAAPPPEAPPREGPPA